MAGADGLRAGTPSLRDYHAAHYRALADAFGVDLDSVPELDEGSDAATPDWLFAWRADHPDRVARATGRSAPWLSSARILS